MSKIVNLNVDPQGYSNLIHKSNNVSIEGATQNICDSLDPFEKVTVIRDIDN